MDESRMQELQLKARTRGLSDQEADDLGRLLAEAQGRRYSNATLEFGPMRAAAEEKEHQAIRQRLRWRRRGPLSRGSRSLEIGMTPVRPEDRDREEPERPGDEARGAAPTPEDLQVPGVIRPNRERERALDR